jgi:hypothetical protein
MLRSPWVKQIQNLQFKIRRSMTRFLRRYQAPYPHGRDQSKIGNPKSKIG